MSDIKIMKKIILIIIVFSICFCSFLVKPVYASDVSDGGTEDSTSVTGDTKLGLPTIDNGYKPTVSEGKATDKVVSILNNLTVLGVVVIVIAIAIMGFGAILGSASDKALKQEQFVGIVIAAGLITGGSIIAKMIISVAETI